MAGGCLPGTLDDLSDLDDVDYADCDIDSGKTNDPPPNESYVFPNIRSGPGRVAATVIDDETADVISIETGVDTVVQKCGNTDCTVAGDTDSYTLRSKRSNRRLLIMLLQDRMVRLRPQAPLVSMRVQAPPAPSRHIHNLFTR